MCALDQVGYFELVIKTYPGGKVSSFLNTLKVSSIFRYSIFSMFIRYCELGRRLHPSKRTNCQVEVHGQLEKESRNARRWNRNHPHAPGSSSITTIEADCHSLLIYSAH